MIRRLLFLLFLSILTQTTFAQTNGLNFTVSTDKERYILGEPVTVKLIWQNVTDKDYKIATYLMMDAVEVFDEDAKDSLQYGGFIVCGSGGYRDLRAGEKFELTNTLNHFNFPSFDLSKPGRYSVKNSYNGSNHEKHKNVWLGGIKATTSFEIVRLDDAALNRMRDKAFSGDRQALQILAAHKDETIISTLAELVKSNDKDLRETIYRMLMVINTNASIQLLAEIATKKIAPNEKASILYSFREMKSPLNPVIIPYLNQMLTDDYATYITRQQEGEPSKKYKHYTYRVSASYLLKKLGIETTTVYEEEVVEERPR